MNPIIDPNIFYWISVCNTARTLSIMAFALSLCAVIGLTIGRAAMHKDWVVGIESWGGKKTEPAGIPSWFPKAFTASCVVMAIALPLMLFVPSSETMYQMMAARLVTPDNLNAAAMAGKDLVKFITDTITEAIKAVK
jgi:hypothetical protein